MQVSAEISEALDKFRFHEASALIYQFIWHELCDWYIELVKPVLTNRIGRGGGAGAADQGSCACDGLFAPDAASVHALHHGGNLAENCRTKGESIMMQEFPAPRKVLENPGSGSENAGLDGTDRSYAGIARRNEYRSQAIAGCGAADPGPRTTEPWFRKTWQRYRSLARLKSVLFPETLSGRYLRGVSKLGEFGLDMHDALNIENERERLQKEIARTEDEIDKVWKKLNSPEFVVARARGNCCGNPGAPRRIVREIAQA